MIPLHYYLVLSALVFGIGVAGVLTARNGIKLLMCIELMLNAANINLVVFSRYLGDISGQVFAVFVISIAAAEVAVGLAIVLMIYRIHGTIDFQKIKEMRW
ncbi:MAG: NADH-quinone oxidoreductase subunit NuoK [Candidatus Hydrothermarchaeota archaeon]|nr:NADH-quinone oxidoreductase subunit NuoK [Candidatus Hydrothermarchaeota archaeon]